MSHHIIFITACAQNVSLQHEHKRVDAGATRQTEHSVTVQLRAAHSLLMRRFSLSMSMSEILVR